MISHGLTTGALFLLVGMLYERRHTYEIDRLQGLVEGDTGVRRAVRHRRVRVDRAARLLRVRRRVPVAARRVPHSRWYVVVATTGVILAAVYMLWAVQRTVTGEPDGDNVGMKDVKLREIVHGRAVARPLAVPRFLPEAGARPGRAQRSTSARRPRSKTAVTTRCRRIEAARRGAKRSRRSTSDPPGTPSTRSSLPRSTGSRSRRRSRCSRPRW